MNIMGVPSDNQNLKKYIQMKTKKWIGVLTLPFFVGAGFGQEMQQAQVPSAVVTSFQQSFPKTYDVEWEMKGENYKVEFETSLTGPDHDVWYDKTGKMIMHKEEIAKSDLPQKVVTKINTEFNSYRVDDVKKITED